MKTRPKLFIVASGIALLVLACLFAALYYLWKHPSAIKSQIEQSISMATGTSVTIGNFSFSSNPLRVQAKNITVSPGKTTDGFKLTVPEFVGHFSLSGPFGRKVLSIDNINITRPSLSVFSNLSVSRAITEPTSSSLLGRMVKPLAAYLAFREIHVQSAQAVNGTIAFRSPELQLHVTHMKARLFPTRQLEVSCSADMSMLSKKLRFHAPLIHFRTEPLNLKGTASSSTIAGQLEIPGGSIESPALHVRDMTLKIRLAYDAQQRRLTFQPATLESEHLTLTDSSGAETVFPGLQVRARGLVDLHGNEVDVVQWHLTASHFLEMAGSLHMGIWPPYAISIHDFHGHLVPQVMVPLVSAHTGGQLNALDLKGPVRVKGNVDGKKGDKQWTWHCDLEASLLENQISYVLDQDRLSGRISGTFKARGSVPNLDYAVMMTSSQTTFSRKGFKLEPFEATFTFTGILPHLSLEELRVFVPRAEVSVGKNKYAVNTMDIKLHKGQINTETRALSLPEVRFSSSLLKNIQASLTHRKGQTLLNLTGNDSHFLEAASSLNLLPSGWRFLAQDSLTLKALFDPAGWSQVDAELALANLRFQDKNERFMGEDIRLLSRLKTRVDLKKGKGTAEILVKADAGEILLDRFYMDLKESRLSVNGKAGYDVPKKAVQWNGVRLDLQNLLALELEGSLFREASRPNMAFSVKLPTTAVTPLVHHFVLEPYKFEKPFLESLQVGGVVAADLGFRRTGEAWGVKGHATWHHGTLSFGDNKDISFDDVELDLPVWCGPAASGKDMKILKGRLSIGSMSLPLLPKQSLVFPIIAAPGSLTVPSSTSIHFPVGKIQVGPITCKDIFSAAYSVETSLVVDGVSLEPVLEKIWQGLAKGVVHGELGKIDFLRNAIQSQGHITANVFGGQIVVTDPGVASLFTPAPLLKLSARLNNLSLTALTEGTSFGRIQGVLEGSIKDLEMVRSQPQRFELWLETMQEEKFPQKISVEAVDNIARLGGGHSPFMGLAGRFVSLFKEFPYKKIGIRSSLENDVFRINGTIKEGGVEYLVKRSGLSGVNVVNLNPDNRASFKDMVKRIKRIQSSRQGPVVK